MARIPPKALDALVRQYTEMPLSVGTERIRGEVTPLPTASNSDLHLCI
jgi:hypothetical protein